MQHNGCCHCGNLRMQVRLTRPPEENLVRSCACSFCRAHATRTVSDEVKIRNRRQCELQSLHEGMILAEDIHAEEGVVLVCKGTHLDGRMIDRLKEIAMDGSAPRTYVWIGDLA